MSNKIETMDRAAINKIVPVLTLAVQSVADDLGLEVKIEGGRFDPELGTFNPKVTFSVGDRERREFAAYAPMFNLDPEADYQAEFKDGRGQTYILVALKPRS